VLRLLVLKHLYDWSFDECEREVRGHLVYRAFCRIDGERVPDAKTLLLVALTQERVRGHRLPPGAATSLRGPSENSLDRALLERLSWARDQPSYPGQHSQYGLHECSHC
jgi:hypothetical protein